LLGLILLVNIAEFVPDNWVLYLVLPLMFSGLALIHGVVAKRKLSHMWLVVFYAVLMLPIVVYMVVLLALLDSWYDFRTRLQNTV
jgi:hypothetical protein